MALKDLIWYEFIFENGDDGNTAVLIKGEDMQDAATHFQIEFPEVDPAGILSISKMDYIVLN